MSKEATKSSYLDDAKTEIASVKSIKQLNDIKAKYIGKKGLITLRLKEIGKLPQEERKSAGARINLLKTELSSMVEQRFAELEIEALTSQINQDKIDVTLPGIGQGIGSHHPISKEIRNIENIFSRLGFEIAFGPEVESEYYNFEALNIPKEHPARAMHDTFYTTKGSVLRTHTSPVQIRYMESHKPPIRIIAPGRVYRCDSDISHTPMFHQIEGLVIDEDLSFADLKGILSLFLRAFFEQELDLRFRPSFFPFTEPSTEVDISCVLCEGSGCRLCKGTGWLEVLGSGMVHPYVLKKGNIDSQQYNGYAFGLGVERLTMLKYGIGDLRLLFENDIDFLSQF